MPDTMTAIHEAHDAYRLALERLRHALDLHICQRLHAVDVQLDELRRMRREAESRGFSEHFREQLNALEAAFEGIRVRLEAE